MTVKRRGGEVPLNRKASRGVYVLQVGAIRKRTNAVKGASAAVAPFGGHGSRPDTLCVAVMQCRRSGVGEAS